MTGWMFSVCLVPSSEPRLKSALYCNGTLISEATGLDSFLASSSASWDRATGAASMSDAIRKMRFIVRLPCSPDGFRPCGHLAASELDAGRQQEGIAFEAVLDAEGAFGGQDWGHWQRTERQGHERTFHHVVILGWRRRKPPPRAPSCVAALHRGEAQLASPRRFPITLPRRPCAFRPLRRRR